MVRRVCSGFSPPFLRSSPGRVNLGSFCLSGGDLLSIPYPQFMFLASVGHLFPVSKEKFG